MKYIKKLVLLVILVLMFLTIFTLITVPVRVTSVIYERSQEELKEQAKEKAFQEWLDKLVLYECPNCPPNFRRVDSNGEYSHSCLQFQRPTFEEMARRYKVSLDLSPDDRSHEAIYSCRIQREIATAMFRDDAKAASRHWHTSIYVKDLGLPPPLN